MEIANLAMECERLARDFGRLALADVCGGIVTERELTWCREPVPRVRDYWRLQQRITAEPVGLNRGRVCGYADGLELSDVRPQTVKEELSAPVWYAPFDCTPIVNTAGQSMVMESGWSTSHEWDLAGANATHAYELLERAGEWTLGRWRELSRLLWPGRGSVAGKSCWPDVVNQVSELAHDATLPRPSWCVIVGPYHEWWPIEMWKTRDEWQLGEPRYTAEDVERIREDPEVVLFERKHWLRDSETALEWLVKQFRKEQPVAPGVEQAVAPVFSSELPEHNLDNVSKVLHWFGKDYEPLERNMFSVIQILYEHFKKGEAYEWVSLDFLRGRLLDVRALDRGMAEVFAIRKNVTIKRKTKRLSESHPVFVEVVDRRGGAGDYSYRLRRN
jgi:hypothetical protein